MIQAHAEVAPGEARTPEFSSWYRGLPPLQAAQVEHAVARLLAGGGKLASIAGGAPGTGLLQLRVADRPVSLRMIVGRDPLRRWVLVLGDEKRSGSARQEREWARRLLWRAEPAWAAHLARLG